LTHEAPSPSSPHLRLTQRASYSSVSAVGGLIGLLEVVAKKPTTTSPAPVVLTDGATKDRRSGVNAPLCESMGADASMPLTSRIAPVAETAETNVQL
jgi:hypothetical protein